MGLTIDLGQPKEYKISDPFQYINKWDFPAGDYSENVKFNFTVPPGKTYRIKLVIAIFDTEGVK